MNILIRRRTTKAARMATAMLLLIALLSNSLLFAQAADESTGFPLRSAEQLLLSRQAGRHQ